MSSGLPGDEWRMVRIPLGTRLVAVNEDFFLELGASRVDWGEPVDGVYVPTVYRDEQDEPVADHAPTFHYEDERLPDGRVLRRPVLDETP